MALPQAQSTPVVIPAQAGIQRCGARLPVGSHWILAFAGMTDVEEVRLHPDRAFRMRPVYQAENLFDAHLVRGRLASEGVEAVVTGEYLAGAMGELPLAGLLAVWVEDDDLNAALELLAAWQAEDAQPEAESEQGGWEDESHGQAFLA